jgi:predicted GH43/DUF377 family glycosyl hydrolase
LKSIVFISLFFGLLHADISDSFEIDAGMVCLGDVFDLEQQYAPYLLETKRLEITEYKDAFNPSVVKWDGKILMAFRIRSENDLSQVGLVYLDEEFNVISHPVKLERDLSITESKLQDPRLIVIGNQLQIIYSDLVKVEKEKIRRVFIGQVEIQGEHFFLRNAHPLIDFEGQDNNLREKNWVPFSFHDELLLSYSISPHKVFKPVRDDECCETVCSSNSKLNWNFGQLRGGTQAIKQDGYYLSFFHSSIKLASIQSNSKMMIHYFMGAYTFDDQPPFKIRSISAIPTLGKDFYSKTDFKTWKPLRVVFPCGLIEVEPYLFLVYGKQDSELWVAKIDKKSLLKSLVSVE